MYCFKYRFCTKEFCQNISFCLFIDLPSSPFHTAYYSAFPLMVKTDQLEMKLLLSILFLIHKLHSFRLIPLGMHFILPNKVLTVVTEG